SIITEVNGSGKLVSRNIRGLELIARKNSVGTLAYYLNNAHGDVSKLVNENGDVLNSYEYDAFGNTTNYTEKVQNRFQYAGEQFDKVTGQYYLRARYYEPTVGRFTTEDTYRGSVNDTMSLNLYSYCENNPVNLIDPSGHWTWKQYDNLGSGMYTRLKDEGIGILQLNPVSMLMNSYKQWDALLSNKITVAEIYAAGFDSIVSDYKYIMDSNNKFASAYLPFTSGASDTQVYNAGYHVAGIIIDLATLAISVDDIVKVVKANRAAIKAGSKCAGKSFDPKGATVQEGVNPNTLKPGKNLDNLDPQRQKNAVKYAGDKPIIVDRNGNVLDGHHRLNDAIKNGRAVDVQIGY
ncbi:MAG: RHS repeat-associated core domain-containing protein, partial [Ruminiclostridium sp.]